MDTAELRPIINKIESISKEQARVDTGTLERSIYGIINEKGIAEFGEMYYGQFGTNSKLEENINKYFPKNEPFKLVYMDFDGVEYVAKERTKRGRTITKEPKIKEPTPPTTSKNIRKFIDAVKLIPKTKDIGTPKVGKESASKKIRNFLKGIDAKETNDKPKRGKGNNSKTP
jgi:hypothetical protein